MQIALPKRPWRGSSGDRQQPDDVALPAYTPELFKLVHFAVGDHTAAAMLLAEVLACSPKNVGEAVRLIVPRLPQGWLTWPGAPSPGQWLKLRLRPHPALQLLSAMGEWTAL